MPASSMIIVKTSFGFASQATCVHHRLLNWVGAIAGFAECLIIHRLCDREIHVNADQVHELKRPHTEPPLETDNPVDFIKGSYALSEEPQRFAVERARESVHDEPGSVFRDHCAFTEPFDELKGRANRRFGGPVSA